MKVMRKADARVHRQSLTGTRPHPCVGCSWLPWRQWGQKPTLLPAGPLLEAALQQPVGRADRELGSVFLRPVLLPRGSTGPASAARTCLRVGIAVTSGAAAQYLSVPEPSGPRSNSHAARTLPVPLGSACSPFESRPPSRDSVFQGPPAKQRAAVFPSACLFHPEPPTPSPTHGPSSLLSWWCRDRAQGHSARLSPRDCSSPRGKLQGEAQSCVGKALPQVVCRGSLGTGGRGQRGSPRAAGGPHTPLAGAGIVGLLMHLLVRLSFLIQWQLAALWWRL